MQRRIVTPWLVAYLALSVASTPSAEKKALAILDAVSQQRSFVATFSYTSQGPQTTPNPAVKGQIAVRDKQYRLTLPGQEIINNGHTLWTYLKDANEVQVADYDPTKSASVPWHVPTHYREEYQFVSLDTRRIRKHPCHVIVLKAKDPTHPLHQVTLAIKKNPQCLQRLEALDQDETLHIFDIIEFDAEVAFEDAFFHFNVKDHEGVEVIEDF